jgi:hypothetical protein
MQPAVVIGLVRAPFAMLIADNQSILVAQNGGGLSLNFLPAEIQ